MVYTDEEGDLVTSIVNQKDCVFTCYDEKGVLLLCHIEKAFRAGKTDFYKPISCHLYPIRIGDYGPYKAVNYHLVGMYVKPPCYWKKKTASCIQVLKGTVGAEIW